MKNTNEEVREVVENLKPIKDLEVKMEYLEQFRKVESELFCKETGKFYAGTRISNDQCELMRNTIDELDKKTKDSYFKCPECGCKFFGIYNAKTHEVIFSCLECGELIKIASEKLNLKIKNYA